MLVRSKLDCFGGSLGGFLPSALAAEPLGACHPKSGVLRPQPGDAFENLIPLGQMIEGSLVVRPGVWYSRNQLECPGEIGRSIVPVFQAGVQATPAVQRLNQFRLQSQ